MPACMRCNRIDNTVQQFGNGLLWLCANCPLRPVCPPYEHEQRGSMVAGTWVCLKCGTATPSQKISTEPVRADVPVYDVYC